MKDKKFTVSHLKQFKEKKEKITMLTAYDYSTAKMMDEAGVDTILVGDSLGMVVLGYEDTLQVTMADMLHHTKAVKRGVKNAFVIGDMPFLSYHISVEEAVRNAGRFVKEAGANAVKLEGGQEVLPQIEGILAAKIPVVGHLGLTPQSVNVFGGFKVQGKDTAQAKQLIEDALALEAAGVCAIVLECVPAKLAKLISEKLEIPTIGIGAGVDCDGQVLVINDIVGAYDELSPKFVKTYGHVGIEMKKAINTYIEEVRTEQFPEEKHSFKIDEALLDKLY
ncbi:MAG: 3-methyl-2-oxobutanoate hydroxymethyltransferase [Clostridia bacterium]|nr:3-methyl-2-oxobutanoate hydroxymethyltransferase [Clostridia bacterium]